MRIRKPERGSTMLRTRLRGPLAAAAVVALATTVAACGSSDNGSSTNGGGNSAQASALENFAPKEGQTKGGTLNALAAEGFEHLDPGQSYFQIDYLVVYATHRPLYSFAPDDATKPVPDLAASDPVISKDDKTVTVKLKPNIKFSPPVNRAVTSKDVKYAIERAFTANVPSGYAGAYFGDLVGSEAATKGGQIKGIETPDDQTIVFKLSKPFAATLAGALTMPITAPVPEEYAKKFDENNPSTYDTKPTQQAFTGPYVIQSYSPASGVTLVRNPNWDPKTDYRPAYADKIVVKTGGDPTVNARQTLAAASGTVMIDTPPAAQVKNAYQKQPSQITFVPLGNHYATLNTSTPPFDNLNIRKAVLAATDRSALVLARGGKLTGDPGTHFLPPTAPGFEDSGGYEGKVDFLKNPQGDKALAAEYMKKAGYPSGKYTGNVPVTIFGANSDPGPRESQIIQQAMEGLGFNVKVRNVPQQTLYSKFCNVPKTKTQVCSTVGWLPDFPDGYAYLYPVFSGNAIVPVNNVNQASLNVPAVNEALDKAQLVPPGPARDKAWADANTLITEQAPAIPYVWDKQALLQGKGTHGVVAKWNADWDLAFTSVEPGSK
jgi:peptide/nickel transport system substrate-binding protein